MTPFQQMGVPSTARGEEMRAKGEVRREYEWHGIDSVTCGVIHTYSDVYAAVEEARFQNRWDDTTKHHVFEMTIPEGERYIVSRDGREKGTLSCRFVRRLTHEETDRIFK